MYGLRQLQTGRGSSTEGLSSRPTVAGVVARVVAPRPSPKMKSITRHSRMTSSRAHQAPFYARGLAEIIAVSENAPGAHRDVPRTGGCSTDGAPAAARARWEGFSDKAQRGCPAGRRIGSRQPPAQHKSIAGGCLFPCARRHMSSKNGISTDKTVSLSHLAGETRLCPEKARCSDAPMLINCRPDGGIVRQKPDAPSADVDTRHRPNFERWQITL